MGLTHLFLIGQALAHLPAMPAGTEVRLMSADLLTIYASARVDGSELKFYELPPVGVEVRILIFPPGADDAARAEALSGATALKGVVSPDQSDILLRFDDGSGPVSLRELLQRERQVWLELVPGGNGR